MGPHTHASNPYFLSSHVPLLFCHLHPISIKPENKNPPNPSTSDKFTFIHWISFHFCGSILFLKVHPIYFHNIHLSIFISFENPFLIKSCSSIHQTSLTIHLIWWAFFRANHQSQFLLEKQKTQAFC